MQINFFDPEMCCSTGVCGASPDPELMRVGAMVEELKANGHTVTRHMLSRDSSAFTTNKEVYAAILAHGMQALPMAVVDGAIRTIGRYPQMDELVSGKE